MDGTHVLVDAGAWVLCVKGSTIYGSIEVIKKIL